MFGTTWCHAGSVENYPQGTSLGKGFACVRSFRARAVRVCGSRCRQQNVCCSSKRVPKNSQDFGKDYDAIRASLQAEGGWVSGLSFSTLLNRVSRTTFGAKGRGVYRALLDFVNLSQRSTLPEPVDLSEYSERELSDVRQFWHAFGVPKRDTGKLLGPVVRVQHAWAEMCSQPRSSLSLMTVSERLSLLAQVLLCTPSHTASLALRCPKLLEMDCPAVTQVLLWLKTLIPKADVSRMIHLKPDLLTKLAVEETRMRAEHTLALLYSTLPGAPIHLMCQEDPYFMFEDVSDALIEFCDLWPEEMISTEALNNSEPQELVLAIRALSPNGAPKTM